MMAPQMPKALSRTARPSSKTTHAWMCVGQSSWRILRRGGRVGGARASEARAAGGRVARRCARRCATRERAAVPSRAGRSRDAEHPGRRGDEQEDEVGHEERHLCGARRDQREEDFARRGGARSRSGCPWRIDGGWFLLGSSDHAERGAIGVKEPTLSPHPPFTLRWAAPAGSWASRCSSPRGGPRASRRCGPGAPGATTPTPTGPSTTRRRPRGRTRRRTSSRRPPRGTRRPCRGSRSPGPSSSRRGRRASSRAAASCPTSTRASAVRSPQGSKRVIQRRFNVSVARARVSETAPTLRERSER